MRYLLILALFLVLLLSGCAGLPDLLFNSGNVSIQQAGLLVIDAESPDALVRVDYQPEIRIGRTENILFDIENKNNFDLDNVVLTIYDSCIFTGDTSNTINKIKANRSATFSLKLTAGNVSFDRDCNVKFKLSYSTQYSLFQDIVVLSKSEYEQRETAGTLKDIPIQFSSPSSPLRISLSLSGEQPFITGEKYYMSLDYTNAGSGFVEVNGGDIKITPPSNVNSFACDNDYDNSLILNKKLTFVSNRASTSTCHFTAFTSQPMDIKSLTITASYKYVLYNSILIKVKRK
jgi:hypothetical protein